MRGPRVIFKDDRDSSIGRGAVLYGGHFRPEVARIVYVAAQVAPDQVTEIVVSEAHRNIRDTRDLHEEGRAFDFSLNVEGLGHLAFEDRRAIGQEWAMRMSANLGPDYTVIVHGEGANLHIHAELDP